MAQFLSDAIIARQNAISEGRGASLGLPAFDRYAICNLRGGIGKTSLAFNLSYLTDDLLVVDTCPQGNLSYFYDNNYYQNVSTTVNDMLLPYFFPGLGRASRVAQYVGATNRFFSSKSSYFMPSSAELYTLPSQMANALAAANQLPGPQRATVIDSLLYSLKTEIDRELQETGTQKVLIDTSPFFSGCTHLAWHAVDALVVPVRTDKQSVNSLSLMLRTLSNPSSEFRRLMPSDNHAPKIQMVVLTGCGWTTRAGARNEPNQQTKVFLEEIRDIVGRNIGHFTTNDPDKHIVLTDDFLGSGRVSSALSKPIELMNAGDSTRINRIKTDVNGSVEKIKNQLKFISSNLW
ncbi:ParA family protein [Burkholderia pseudomallei]|uniref:ParA family protein n=1 Tax=Burkholderia pseudomallei TaxID=28450 RepID=UPI0003D8C5C6|nr:ParA family protein [Burkholderia pseudomallei]AHE27098.1 cobQ/CobB/MinD/ParA nucleotide binding domain protein [Burkholderia pseudomallei NCTC 13178]AIV90486.1 cobQ/CobB/MinD/ParA nucleotide binding domain protein [Burkholderia pseudomallei B03]AIV96483.1 cobQ/CobB/MinD/ParA nucleotide binding domain protein [Burkholderia pseudomallei A79A]KGC75146.1 cobQ/CobB/MinD/ParA nucleotide binding domain protein [Burkholderia pseudomallei]KGS37271.1 cobQ/CobB/MinD/ParA nucleotide binding domain pro